MENTKRGYRCWISKYIIEWGHIMDNIRLFRKRFIPEEIIELKNDNIIHFKELL